MKQKSLWLKWLLSLTPLVLAGLMYFLLPKFPKFTEYIFARGIFRAVAFPLEYLVSLIPFSVTEMVVVLLAPTIITLLAFFVYRLVKGGNPKKTAERGVRFLCTVFSFFLFVFMLTDGANFSRMPLRELMKLPKGEYTVEELYIVTSDLAKKASTAREKFSEDKNGVVALSVTKKQLLKNANNVYENIAKDYHFLKTGATRVKSVALSHWWSYTGTTGVYCPWTLEANVNTDVPVSGLGFTSAHEIAHTMGFAKEMECNFLAFLGCATSGQADYEYSGYLSAFIYCSNDLYRADKELWENATLNCSAGVIRDIKCRNDYWDGFNGEIMDTAQSVNDSFIKVNGVESGVLSYNQMVDLVLSYYDSLGFFSINR
ncbi:MAG: DUF3810 domain-containing protein [Clostridia bacterium]|nr:DUF3810 domain-containing protein [Clostridia bacterium]